MGKSLLLGYSNAEPATVVWSRQVSNGVLTATTTFTPRTEIHFEKSDTENPDEIDLADALRGLARSLRQLDWCVDFSVDGEATVTFKVKHEA